MELKNSPDMEISENLLDAIRSFPVRREIEHCGARILVEPFEFYAECPRCAARIKVRSFSASNELEDVFDAVFEWMNQPNAQEIAARRRTAIENDE